MRAGIRAYWHACVLTDHDGCGGGIGRAVPMLAVGAAAVLLPWQTRARWLRAPAVKSACGARERPTPHPGAPCACGAVRQLPALEASPSVGPRHDLGWPRRRLRVAYLT